MNGQSLMTKWLEQASQLHEMYCHDQEVMSLNLGRVVLDPKIYIVLTFA